MGSLGKVISFDEIIGHKEALDTLLKALRLQRVAHAYLFMGPAGLGKTTTAMAFAASLLCERAPDGSFCGSCRSCRQIEGGNNPDLQVVEPSGATIKLEQVKQLQRNINYKSYQGGRQVYLIKQCDTMTAEAANSLLKTLEDPPGNAVFILITSRPYGILPTISSRCQNLWFYPLAKDLVMAGLKRYSHVQGDRAAVIAAMAGGSIGRALELVDEEVYLTRERMLAVFEKIRDGDLVQLLGESASLSGDRDAALGWLQLLQLWFRDLLVWQQTKDKSLIINIDLEDQVDKYAGEYSTDQLMDMLKDIERARSRLEAKGNGRLVLDALLLRLADIPEAKGG
ncbi:DNA polymerase III subunit delta' [Desulfofalx alkaliphila]|uniref:DNA polymerase III subunit delta' n=1 Tax=Desulfofalx alkaliphila TaxID=105483 RepID=UPI0004E14042|nr:DNA polymerase III subunit delta' [Desulfofalx alkaliphila]